MHVSLNQERPARVPPCGPAALAVPSRYRQRADKAGILSEGPCIASRKGSQLLEQLREGCSSEREVTSPGSARQLQATAASEKRGCLYSRPPFPLPFVCRHVTAEASHQHNGYLDSFGAGTRNCDPANKTLCLSELSQRFVNSH